jgi:hypothetical protein
LESLLLAGKILGLGVEVEVDCLAPFLVGMFVNLQLGMLFAMVAGDRLLLAVVYGFGLDAACSCMAGSIARDIYGRWVGILDNGCSFGMKLCSRMMIVKVDASGMFEQTKASFCATLFLDSRKRGQSLLRWSISFSWNMQYKGLS